MKVSNKVLFQIDSCLGIGSTGRISEQIGALAREAGWETYIAHGSRYVGSSRMHAIQVGSKWSEYLHYAQGLLLDNHGLASLTETKRLISRMEEIHPDVVQLHCIHGYYLNYQLLFEYLNRQRIPVVWTFHDCWAFTGHCAYFDSVCCTKWKDKEGCRQCPLHRSYPKAFVDRAARNFQLKKQLFTSLDKLTVVSCSDWIDGLAKQSFLKNNSNFIVIKNGVDMQVFYPRLHSQMRSKYGISTDKFVLLGVALPWSARKGFDDFLKLAADLDADRYSIVLIGVSDAQKQTISQRKLNVIALNRTNSAAELAEWYSTADLFLNPTYSDNYPTTNLEAIACGTPIITYDTGGSPEAVSPDTGLVVPQGDYKQLLNAVYFMANTDFKVNHTEACREHAMRRFDTKLQFMKYINLYEEIISR